MNPLLTLLFFLTALSAQAQSIHFITSGKLQAAQDKAQETGKIIFVDVYTDWCGPCKMMDRQVFADPEVAERMNAFFVNLKANAEEGGRSLASDFSVWGFPTLLFVHPDGSLIEKHMGAMNKAAFLSAADNALKSTDYGQAFLLYENAWNAGKRSADMASLYFKLRAAYAMSNAGPLEQFLQSLPKDSLGNLSTEKIVVRYATEINGAAFDYLAERKNTARCKSALDRVVSEHHKRAAAEKSEKLLKQTVEAAGRAALSPEEATLRQAQLKMEYYLKMERPERFHAEAAAYVPLQLLPLLASEQDSAKLHDYVLALENIAWQYTEFVKNKAHLAEALSWLEKCPGQALSPECLRHKTAMANLTDGN